jgi:undecaprenyl-diphosphatase
MPCRISAWPGRPGSGKPATDRSLPIREALVLGALHGPAELLPVSSSAHVNALPWLLGWRYPQLEDELRKAFEVALHTGALAGWLLWPGTSARKGLQTLMRPTRKAGAVLALATLPPAVAGLTLERPIERRLGTPATIASGLLAGGLAMLIADRAPGTREAEQAQAGDGLWLGVAQACALLPGVSRSGATLAAARLRLFTPSASRRLSAQAGLPVIIGATTLKLTRLLQSQSQSPAGRPEWAGLASGAGASFISTALLAPMLDRTDRQLHLSAFALYRAALGLGILARLRDVRATKRGSRAGRRRRARI